MRRMVQKMIIPRSFQKNRLHIVSMVVSCNSLVNYSLLQTNINTLYMHMYLYGQSKCSFNFFFFFNITNEFAFSAMSFLF